MHKHPRVGSGSRLGGLQKGFGIALLEGGGRLRIRGFRMGLQFRVGGASLSVEGFWKCAGFGGRAQTLMVRLCLLVGFRVQGLRAWDVPVRLILILTVLDRNYSTPTMLLRTVSIRRNIPSLGALEAFNPRKTRTQLPHVRSAKCQSRAIVSFRGQKRFKYGSLRK